MAEENMQVDNGAQPSRVVKVNYPSNSNKAKSESKPKIERTEKASEKKVEKVISGEVVQRKKGLGRKIAETFTGDDMHSVGNFILFEVALPALKTMISDAVSQGAERALFGESSRSRRPSMGSRYTNYSSYSKGSGITGRAGEADGPRNISSRGRASHEFNEIILATRGEAEEVVDRLNDLIKEYDQATVSDLYDLVGVTATFADEKWGWSNLRGAGVQRVREGYLLNLPRTEPLD